MYQCHLTATSLTLLGQCPQAHIHVPPGRVRSLSEYGSIFCRTACHNCCKAGNYKCYDYSLNQHIFTQKASNSNYTFEFYSLAPPPPPCTFFGHIGLPPPLLLPFIVLLLTSRTQQTHNDNMSPVYYIHVMADNTLVSQIILLTYWYQWDSLIYKTKNRDTKILIWPHHEYQTSTINFNNNTASLMFPALPPHLLQRTSTGCLIAIRHNH